MKHLKPKTTRKAGMAVGCLVACLLYIFMCAVSWAISCGVMKLITLCFGWNFSIGTATGIWLVMFLCKHVFNMGEIRIRE